MAAGVTIKPKRKAGALVGGDLAAGEIGLDTTNKHWYYSSDGSTVVQLLAPGSHTAAYLTADTSSTSTSLADVTGIACSVAANKDYLIVVEGGWTSNSSTDGIKIDFTGPSSPDNVFGSILAFTATNTFRIEPFTAFSSAATVTVGPGATQHPVRLILHLENGANAGTVQLRYASEVGNTVTLKRGLVMTCLQLN